MTMPVREKSISTIDELANAVEKNNYKVLYTKGAATIEAIQSNSRLQATAQKMIENNWYYELVNGSMPHTIKKNYAFVGTATFYQIHFGVKPFATKFISNDIISARHAGLAVLKRFCCKKKLHWSLNRVVECGLYTHYIKQLIIQKMFDKPFERTDSPIRSLSIEDLKGIFYFLSFGLLLAFIVLLFEICSIVI